MVKIGVLVGFLVLLTMTAFTRDVQTVVINGYQMVSLRTFGEVFDVTIDYDNGRDGITISLDDQYVDFIPYSRSAWVNDHKVILDAPVVIIDDITYVPVQFLCDVFGFSCKQLSPNTTQVVVRSEPEIRVVIVLDTDWCNFPHVWRYIYNARDYANMHHGTDRTKPHKDQNSGNHDRDKNNDTHKDQRPGNDGRWDRNNGSSPRVDGGTKPKDSLGQHNGTTSRDNPRQYNGSISSKLPAPLQRLNTMRDSTRQNDRYQRDNNTSSVKPRATEQISSSSQKESNNQKDDRKKLRDK